MQESMRARAMSIKHRRSDSLLHSAHILMMHLNLYKARILWRLLIPNAVSIEIHGCRPWFSKTLVLGQAFGTSLIRLGLRLYSRRLRSRYRYKTWQWLLILLNNGIDKISFQLASSSSELIYIGKPTPTLIALHPTDPQSTGLLA
jgi:hypothetical protein